MKLIMESWRNNVITEAKAIQIHEELIQEFVNELKVLAENKAELNEILSKVGEFAKKAYNTYSNLKKGAIKRVLETAINGALKVVQLIKGSAPNVASKVERVLNDLKKAENMTVAVSLVSIIVGLATGDVDVDETSLEYNFIGNDRKPFYVCTWLASKAVPAQGVGSAAGFLFFQTRDGFHFKSIDNIFGQGSPSKKFIYNNTGELASGYESNILNYNIESDTELHQNLALGTYNNKSIFFDFLAMNYREVNYSIDDQEGGVQVAGQKGEKYNFVAKEFSQTPSRFMTHILDIGVNPKGSGDSQLQNQMSNPGEPNFKAEETMVQSIMRYNQLFTVKTQITIPGDFSIKAGDLVQCDFPQLSGADLSNTNTESGGIYMVAHVCHRSTSDGCFSSLGLVRDSYGKRSGF